jgi:hypothetical protein
MDGGVIGRICPNEAVVVDNLVIIDLRPLKIELFPHELVMLMFEFVEYVNL